MNIAPMHLEALKALGYTEVEALVLYLVATHSGYFTARQFLAFTGAHWGKRTTTFWNKLHSQRHSRTECFPKGGVVHHLFSRRLYRRIEKKNLRNRREHEFDFIKRCIAILDFVLLNQGNQYLETETEKLRFFCETLNIAKHFLPSSLYLSSNTGVPTVRYFGDKFPMFVVPPSPVVTFTYVHEGSQRFTDFIRHLRRYLPLFRQLSEFRLAYASRADWQFEKATEIFHSFVWWAHKLVRYHLRPAAEKAKIGQIGWHTFRHTYSTLLRAYGADMKVQQELLRHSDIWTTMNIYTHTVSPALREANSKVVRMILPEKKTA
jgi:hypothetical protein